MLFVWKYLIKCGELQGTPIGVSTRTQLRGSAEERTNTVADNPTFHYFGYGSLVNGRTRTRTIRAWTGTLTGWKRQWRIAGQTPRGKICTLTVTPEASSSIRSVIIEDEVHRLADLDEREWRYDRHSVSTAAFSADETQSDPVSTQAAYIYSAKQDHYRWGDDDHPILQSYVDCVLKGFLGIWGEDGVRHFVEETEGWHVPMLRDRKQPIYPRAEQLTPEEEVMFDDILHSHGARWL